MRSFVAADHPLAMANAEFQQALLQRAESLQPNFYVRLMIFWSPVVGAVIALSYIPGFQSLQIWLRVLSYVGAVLSGLWLSGYIAYLWQIKPLPTDAELAKLGGQRFVRPSDGKVMEYWVSGTVGSTKVVAFCHRMDGKQGADYGHEEVDQLLRENNACLVSPSCPGCSGSPPYNTDSPSQWLKQYKQDWIALLEKLGAEEVYATGVSFGAQCAASLAEELKAHGKLRACAPIGGFWFNTQTEEYAPQKGSTLLCSGLLMRPLYYYCWSMLQQACGDFESAAKQMSPKDGGESELKDLKKFWGKDDLNSWNLGGLRTHDYFRHYALQYTRLAWSKEAKSNYVDWMVFNDPSVRFVLWKGDGDELVPLEAQQKIKAEVGQNAQLNVYDGTHGGFPFKDIIKDMLS
jgi:pimeloyl-ACP methyl ester carboxylesterase